MRIDFYRQYRQFFFRKRLLWHAFILLYGLLIVAVSMTQTTTAYFQHVETIESSIQMASHFEVVDESSANSDSEAEAEAQAQALDKQSDSKDTTNNSEIDSSDEQSGNNNEVSEETDSISNKDINQSDDDAEENDSQHEQNETKGAEINNDERE